MQDFHRCADQSWILAGSRKILVFQAAWSLKWDAIAHLLRSRIQRLNQKVGRGCESLGLRCRFRITGQLYVSIWLDLLSPWNPCYVQLNRRKQSRVWAGATHACCCRFCIAACHGMGMDTTVVVVTVSFFLSHLSCFPWSLEIQFCHCHSNAKVTFPLPYNWNATSGSGSLGYWLVFFLLMYVRDCFIIVVQLCVLSSVYVKLEVCRRGSWYAVGTATHWTCSIPLFRLDGHQYLQ